MSVGEFVEEVRVARLLLRARPERQRRRLLDGEERVYVVWRITLPVKAARQLGLDVSHDEELLLAILRTPRWYHLYNYNDYVVRARILPRLERRAKLELCVWGLAPDLCGDMEPLIVMVPKSLLEKHGLKPLDVVDVEEMQRILEEEKSEEG